MEFKSDIGKPWRFEEDGLTVTRSAVWSPPGCHPVSCGVKFYVNKDGILEKVEGDENQPVTNGRLCPRCLAMKEFIYNPSRVIYPMKRAREDRGKNKWKRITWDEAYDLIEEKTRYYTETYGPECIAAYSGTGRDGGIMIQEYAFRMLGTPNACYCQSGYACYTPRSTTVHQNLGSGYPEIDYAGGLEGGLDNPEFKLPEVIITWGKEPLPSNPDGLFGHAVIDMMKRGSKLFSVDPRLNWLATRADLHVRLRPGTDAALALAMLNVIIGEELYDKEFVELWTYGFDELAERVKEYPPEKAAEICGVSVEDIYEIARRYAQAKPAQIVYGLAIDQQNNGMQAGQAIVDLMAITGNLDNPGGQLLGLPVEQELTAGARPAMKAFGWDDLGTELQNKTIGIKEYPAYVSSILNAQADLMLECLETDKPYKLRMGYVSSTNLLAPTCSAQPLRWHAALTRLEWCFATDCFITPTIQACCELILPLTTVAEHDAVTGTHYTMSAITIGAMSKAIDVGETKSDKQIIFELGKRLKPELWESVDTVIDYIEEIRLTNYKHSFEELREKVHVRRGNTYYKYEKGLLRPDGNPGFRTLTGRVELWSTYYARYGDDPLPYFQEPPFSPVSTPELMKEYPFVLTTGARTYSYFHSEHRQIPMLRELNPNPLAEIHPDDARDLGITDGQWVELSNQFGAAKFKAKVTPTVYKGLVHAQHGWWFPEDDPEEPSLFGVWKSNINDLIPHKMIGKLGFGANYKSMICKVVPLNENLDVDMQAFQEKFRKLVS
jgi:anaerobic selenocysteine-containing dehydrogenase